jgi:hypothetical protein
VLCKQLWSKVGRGFATGIARSINYASNEGISVIEGTAGLDTQVFFGRPNGIPSLIEESLPIYSGGLGVLAGDHRSSSDLGIPLWVGLSIQLFPTALT